MLDSFTQGKQLLEEQLLRISSVAEARDLCAPLEKIRDINAKLNNDTFYIAVFGGFSSGKSTFLNALVGEKLFPSLHTPTTAAINYLTHDESPRITVNYKTRQELEANRKSGIQEYASADLAYNRLGTRREIPMAELPSISRENRESIYIQDISIRHPSEHLKPKGVVWVDTPGTDSVIEYHKSVTYGLIDKADAIFFFMCAPIPFKDSDWRFLRDIRDVRNAIKVDKFFFVVNAIDAVEDQPLDEVMSFIRSQLVRKAGIERPQMLPVSSKLALYARRKRSGGLSEGEDREYRRMLMAYTDRPEAVSPDQAEGYSRFRELEGVLSDFLTRQKASHLLASSADRALGHAGDVMRDIGMQRLSLEKSVEELDAIINQRLLPDLGKKEAAIAETVSQMSAELAGISPQLGRLEAEAVGYMTERAEGNTEIDPAELEDIFNRNIYTAWKEVESRTEQVAGYHYREIQRHFESFNRTVQGTMGQAPSIDYAVVARDLGSVRLSDFMVDERLPAPASGGEDMTLGMGLLGGALAFLIPGGMGFLGGAILGGLAGKVMDM